MRKKVLKTMVIITFMVLAIGLNVPLQANAEELYKEGTLTIPLDYTDYQYAEVELPSDGYIVISHDTTYIDIEIDGTEDAHRIYGEDEYKINLKKGKHKPELFMAV